MAFAKKGINRPYGINICFDVFVMVSPGRKQIGRQVEGFPLFGCAAAGCCGIQYK